MKKLVIILCIMLSGNILVAKTHIGIKKCLWVGDKSVWYVVYGGIAIPILSDEGDTIRCNNK